MRITSVETVLLTGPSTNDPYALATKGLRSAAFVEVRTNAGFVGVGETYLGYFFPEIVPPVVEFFAPILMSADDPLAVETLVGRMRDCSVFWGRVGIGATVITAIEAALLDLKGKALGIPVHKLLGGCLHDRLSTYASGGTLNWPSDREELLEALDFYLECGFRAVKLASGYFDGETRASSAGRSAEGIAELEARRAELFRQHVGPDVPLLLDAHQGFQVGGDRWSFETAKKVLEAVEPYNIFLFEEPLAYSDPASYGRLARASEVPVAGGEQLTTLAEFRAFADHDAFDVAQPDAGWVSPSDFVAIGRLFEERGRRVASHCWGAGGAFMQNVHAAFATPNTAILEALPLPGPLHTELWGDSLRMAGGLLLPPEAPGLGVRLTDELKERFPFRPGHEEYVGVPGKPWSGV
jgi:L-alanine-DL-glutamate epimerase-like enolase superfamily enzyme